MKHLIYTVMGASLGATLGMVLALIAVNTQAKYEKPTHGLRTLQNGTIGKGLVVERNYGHQVTIDANNLQGSINKGDNNE